MKALKLLLALCGVLLCLPGAAQQCPLGNDEKALLRESAIRNRLDAAWIVNQSSAGGFPSRAFSRSLIGSTSAHTGVATLVEQCSAPRTFDEFCELCEEGQLCPTAFRCSQLACERALVDTAKIWWEPAPFEYRTDQAYFQGYTVSYARRPTIRLRYDARSAGVLHIQWIANDSATVRRNDTTINARSLLIARGLRTGAGPQSADLIVFYPELADGQSIVSLTLHVDEHGVLTGAIRRNSRTLANITEGPGEEIVVVQWLGECA
jgi:hypothetical protein